MRDEKFINHVSAITAKAVDISDEKEDTFESETDHLLAIMPNKATSDWKAQVEAYVRSKLLEG